MLQQSWLASANEAGCHFPLNNLPYGVFSTKTQEAHCGVAIGDSIFDITSAEADGIITLPDGPYFAVPSWNNVMAKGPDFWAELRMMLTALFAKDAPLQTQLSSYLIAQDEAVMHMPFIVAEFTDFYAGRHHATNVGTMFRGAENALPPNWLHIPIGYNGRASSVVISGTDITRPHGQLKAPDADVPIFAPSKRFDFELELGAIIGSASNQPVSVDEADKMIFGYVILNDWSARDIQAWEYQPLGPFQAKATATSISPWIVTSAALEPFRVSTPARDFPLLEHIKDTSPMLYDIDLTVSLTTAQGVEMALAHTNYSQMYYSSAQQLAHHTSSACPMRTGDLLGSGTISGPNKDERGSLLELSWGGKEPLTLPDGSKRAFIEDNDTITMTGAAKMTATENGDGYHIGFGVCTGTVRPAK